jgi:hypothetical protein
MLLDTAPESAYAALLGDNVWRLGRHVGSYIRCVARREGLHYSCIMQGCNNIEQGSL